MRLILGTRGSLLARTQSGHVRDRLLELDGDLEIAEEVIRTEGDRLQQQPPQPGETLAKGLFTGALERALESGEIDFAVHSLKDVPTELAEGMVLAAIPRREDVRDAFLSNGPGFCDLAAGARVATGSPRRAMQIARLRPELHVVPVRGNVDTRIRKLRDGEFDGMVLAVAGLARLGRAAEIVERFEPEDLLPAPGQGALAVEMRAGEGADHVASLLDDAPTRAAVQAERAVLAGIGGGCNLPLGAYARVEGTSLTLSARLFSSDGSRVAERTATGSTGDAATIGRELGRQLLDELGGA